MFEKRKNAKVVHISSNHYSM